MIGSLAAPSFQERSSALTQYVALAAPAEVSVHVVDRVVPTRSACGPSTL